MMSGAGMAPAVTVLTGGTNWTAAFDAGGVTGDVGCLLDPFDGSESGVIEGYYGHSVDGPTCQGSDTRIKTNYLLVKLTRELNDPASIGVVASVTMHKINSRQQLRHWAADMERPGHRDRLSSRERASRK
jgi:hypothetical protein